MRAATILGKDAALGIVARYNKLHIAAYFCHLGRCHELIAAERTTRYPHCAYR